MGITTEIPARDWTFEIDLDDTDDWVEIDEINNWSPSPSATDANTTTFKNDGRTTHFKASRGDALTLTGIYAEDPDTGDRDPGQAAVEELGNRIGRGSTAPFRVTSPGGTVKGFWASATVTSGGGGNDDPTAWSAALVVSGTVDGDVVVPAVPGVPSGVAGTNGNTLSVITWTAGTGTPTEYQVEVSLAVGGTIVGTAKTTTTGIVFTGLTNSVGYKARVRAKNAGGWGTWTALSATFTPTS